MRHGKSIPSYNYQRIGTGVGRYEKIRSGNWVVLEDTIQHSRLKCRQRPLTTGIRLLSAALFWHLDVSIHI